MGDTGGSGRSVSIALHGLTEPRIGTVQRAKSNVVALSVVCQWQQDTITWKLIKFDQSVGTALESKENYYPNDEVFFDCTAPLYNTVQPW